MRICFRFCYHDFQLTHFLLFYCIFSRLVRQDNVKEDSRMNDQRTPNKRTFVEAKQILPEYDDMNQMGQMGQMNQMNHMNHMNKMNAYNDSMYNSENTFREADEDDNFEGQQPQPQPQQYQSNYYAMSEPRLQYEEDEVQSHVMRHTENYMVEPQYSPPEENASWYGRKERPYRRRSREFGENEMAMPPNEDEHRRKPETMRSISEDTPTRTAKQAVTRRTLSHPEKDTHSQVASTIL